MKINKMISSPNIAKNKSIFHYLVIILFSMMAGFFFNQELVSSDFSKRIEEPQETGGAEVPLETTQRSTEESEDYEPRFLFPVSESDFKMYTSPFGHRVSPILGYEMKHQGLDILSVWRAEVVAVADGVVEEHWPAPGTPYPGGGYYKGHRVYGGMIAIRHSDDSKTLYAHLHSTRVKTGDRVIAGEPIGRIGGTGLSRGEHLHFEVIINDERVNPLLYIPNL